MPPTSDRLLADKTLERLRAVSVATVTMQLLKRGLRHTFIQGPRPLNPQHARFAAEAYTLRTIPMREDLSTLEVLADPEYPQRKAIEACPPGQVLVCDCRGVQRAGALGDILITRLMVRGVAAFVTDGPMRDAAAVAAIEFPTFCTGSAAPASLAAHYAAAVQDPIACGGVAVFPGDVLVGDPDGVCVIPRGIADDVARDAGEQELMEEFILNESRTARPCPARTRRMRQHVPRSRPGGAIGSSVRIVARSARCAVRPRSCSALRPWFGELRLPRPRPSGCRGLRARARTGPGSVEP